MQPLHEDLARIGLAALADFGFALAGGYAVQAHGLLTRPSDDVDMFTTMAAEDRFPEAIRTVIAAYTNAGITVSVVTQTSSFARLDVTSPERHESAKVEFGIDWRRHPPTIMDIGPVLNQDDAVANKVCALYSRAQARDYIDVHAALVSGRYTREQLLTIAIDHDPGFEPATFALALAAIRRIPDADFAAYNLDAAAIDQLRSALLDWAHQLAGKPNG